MSKLFQFAWFHNLGAVAIFVIWVAAFFYIEYRKNILTVEFAKITDKKVAPHVSLLLWSCLFVQAILAGILALILALIFF